MAASSKTLDGADDGALWQQPVPERAYSALELVSREQIYNSCPLRLGSGQTRLVEVSPGVYPEPLRCRLYGLDLDGDDWQIPTYTALSYVWGDSTVLQPIGVNGGMLGITGNLHAALVYLRDAARPRSLWIDALCINQADVDERNGQVGQMGRIYGAAADVVAWLGEAADDSDAALGFLCSRAWDGGVAAGPRVAAALDSFFARPYWTRVWVVQELAAARVAWIRCGNMELSLAALADYLSRQRLAVVDSDSSTHAVAMYLLRLALRQDHGADLCAFLTDSAQLEATRPVDKIYGLLGLFPPAFRDRLLPDYRKSFQSLMVELVRVCTAVYGRLDILVYFAPLAQTAACTGAAPGASCPSWIPSVGRRAIGLREHYNTPGARAPVSSLRLRVSESMLEAAGFIVSRIASVQGPLTTDRATLEGRQKAGGAASSAPPSRPLLEKVHATAMECLAATYPGRPRSELEDRFLTMAAGDRIYGHYSQPRAVPGGEVWRAMAAAELRAMAAAELHAVGGGSGTGSGNGSDSSNNNVYNYYYNDISRELGSQFEFTFARLDGRCFFTTSTGHIGVGAGDIRVGDLVCVIYGCRLPVVLRPDGAAADGRGHHRYTFHCPAYLDGIMAGETQIVADAGCGPDKDVTFCIV